MKPGQFWPIRLSDGRFACGRVLQIARDHGEASTKMFLAGLMDWASTVEPNSGDLAGSQILTSGSAHIKTITNSGACITGFRELAADGLTIPLSLSHVIGSDCYLKRGYDILELASEEDRSELQPFSTWGYNFINLLAEELFVAV